MPVLYSLQSVILNQLVKSEGVEIQRALREEILGIHDQIEIIYAVKSFRKFERMRKFLLRIWWLKEVLLGDYMLRHPELQHAAIFSKLKVLNNETSSTGVYEWGCIRRRCYGCILS